MATDSPVLVYTGLKEWWGSESSLFFFLKATFETKSSPDTDGTKDCLKCVMTHGRIYGSLVNWVAENLKWKHALMEYLRLSVDFDLRVLLAL